MFPSGETVVIHFSFSSGENWSQIYDKMLVKECKAYFEVQIGMVLAC